MSPEAELGDEDAAEVVRAGYDAIAGRYALYAATGDSHPRHAWLDLLLDRLEVNRRVLELGCGPGVPTAARLVEAGHHVVGVDISDAQISLARRLVPVGRFIRGDLLDFDAGPASYDAVVALYSLIHVPRRRYPELLARVRQWLSPKGWLLASFGTADSPGWLQDRPGESPEVRHRTIAP